MLATNYCRNDGSKISIIFLIVINYPVKFYFITI